MITVCLLRHGATEGNIERRYIGSADEPLCSLGLEQAKALYAEAPACDIVFSSPLSRAYQTAAIVFPDKNPVIIHDLRECDFGDFTGKTADEMCGSSDYRAWVNAGCETPIPGGEKVSFFKERCIKAFLSAIGTLPDRSTAVFVTHGGTIMAILEGLADAGQGFFAYSPRNCEYVTCFWENGKLVIQGEHI